MITIEELAEQLNRKEWVVTRALRSNGYIKQNGDPRKSTIDAGLMNKNGLITRAGVEEFTDMIGVKEDSEEDDDEIEDEDEIDDSDDDDEEDSDDDPDEDDSDDDDDNDDDDDYEPDPSSEEWYDLIYSFDVEILNEIMEMDGIWMFTIVYKKDDEIYSAYVNVETRELEDEKCYGPYSEKLEREVNDKILDEWKRRFDEENPKSRGEPAWVRSANARAKRKNR